MFYSISFEFSTHSDKQLNSGLKYNIIQLFIKYIINLQLSATCSDCLEPASSWT